MMMIIINYYMEAVCTYLWNELFQKFRARAQTIVAINQWFFEK